MSDWDNDGKAGWGAESTPPSKQDSEAGDSQAPEERRDWKLIEKLVLSMQSEQRKSRRWGIFFKSLTFIYLFALLFLLKVPVESGLKAAAGPHTAVVEINGPIAADEEANADDVIAALRDAFEATEAKAVLLRINSPGGSPVQAGYINDEIERLKGEHPDKKVYAVISDIGASGAYYIAVAADEIYADKASLVGSIGVVAGGFGFTGLMDKLGVERRLYTAGKNKAFLDPFSPEKPGEVAFWQNVLETTHQQFIEQVREGRGDRLKENDQLFSGLVWTGEQALGLGLIDGLGSARYVAREVVGEKKMVDYSRKPSPFKQLVDDLGVSVGSGLAQALVQSRLELR
ncbi:S49 family peptidase [Marinobacter halodurans]|uniref:S49 family peptidase n=1 Tax=Marinobacter halodurans TaxID=2528979 RepID=A0ABY1ZE60_9GAMM|nr:S49 family peptidase [Marinobacter halodurans]TBW48052.1 S49 family peptidase [Marinobacter halodurans]